MRSSAIAMCAAVAFAAGGCPKAGGPGADTVVVEDSFECNDRRAEYVVAGGFVAPEAGVIAQCGDGKPRIGQWTQSEDGQRDEKTHLMGSDTFDAMWKAFDNAGWRHAKEECDNPDSSDQDPLYTIEIVDYAVTKTLTCQGKEIPFPYHQIVRELDVRAAAAGE